MRCISFLGCDCPGVPLKRSSNISSISSFVGGLPYNLLHTAAGETYLSAIPRLCFLFYHPRLAVSVTRSRSPPNSLSYTSSRFFASPISEKGGLPPLSSRLLPFQAFSRCEWFPPPIVCVNHVFSVCLVSFRSRSFWNVLLLPVTVSARFFCFFFYEFLRNLFFTQSYGHGAIFRMWQSSGNYDSQPGQFPKSRKGRIRSWRFRLRPLVWNVPVCIVEFGPTPCWGCSLCLRM